MKPSHFIVVFLLGGIAVSWLVGARRLSLLLGILLLIFVAVAVLAALFQRPGGGGDNHSQ
jgi:hypothetical protein